MVFAVNTVPAARGGMKEGLPSREGSRKLGEISSLWFACFESSIQIKVLLGQRMVMVSNKPSWITSRRAYVRVEYHLQLLILTILIDIQHRLFGRRHCRFSNGQDIVF